MSLNNPRAEATAALPPGMIARVLEPSPPAVVDEWFADDSVNTDGPDVAGNDVVVSPVGIGAAARSWQDLIEQDPSIAAFAQERWLGAYLPIGQPPTEYQTTMTSLHRLAMAAIAPLRHQATGKFGLRWVLGGFGTPFFGDETQVRVLGSRVVLEHAGEVREHAATTINEVAAAIGATVDIETATEHDSPAVGDCDEPLTIDDHHASYIADWWGMGTAALEIVRNDPVTVNPGRVQLWPGHFDVGVEFGTDDARASFGASPGDANHAEPYLYAAAWWPDKLDIGESDFFNAQGFIGAELSVSGFSNEDPVATAVSFFTMARDLLAAAVKDA